jgi:hypothetical protein
MIIDRLLGRRTVEITCEVDIEQSPDSLHAYAIPQGIEINPGDTIYLHDVPTRIGYNERRVMTCRATVVRAGWFDRWKTEMMAIFQLTELYHVGFEPKEAAHV